MKMLLLTLIFTMFMSLLTAPPYRTLYILKSTEECNVLNWSNIDFYIDTYAIRQPEIVKAQIKHETANLTSRFCREQNNLCGMRLARCRATTAIGQSNRMAVYGSWQKSLEDYKLWQDYFYKGGDYYEFLSRHGYATDRQYIAKLKRLL